MKRYYFFAGIAVFTLLITVLHFSVLQPLSPNVVLEELYYIPLFFGALFFGLKGALVTYSIVSLLYLPFLSGSWTATFIGMMDRVLHLVFSGIFVFLAGFLVDRERRRQQQEEKDRYLAGIGQVATAIVHDLKNPLITIIGFAKRIREGKGSVDAAAQSIIESAQNMQQIVNDVLDFAKPVHVTLKEEDLRGVIMQASDACREKAAVAGVQLSVDVPDQPLYAAADSFTLQRALVNLINNAIEASGKGQSVMLSVSTAKQLLLITIKDRGSGIDSETLENMFAPFYTRKTGGTGLGLPIAKKIIEAHKGTIRVSSTVGAGTEVVIGLPAAPVGPTSA